MADTRLQLEVEKWVCSVVLPRKYGRTFAPKPVRLTPGGSFDFDAVSDDGKIVACISTSGWKTSSGKGGTGKVQKIRSDMFFLLLARGAKRRVAVFTEPDMAEFWQGEHAKGRLPKSIELLKVSVPGALDRRLRQARKRASREVGSKR